MKITVVGTGYVGLVTGACLADVGIQVTCVDIDQKKIDGLENGVMPIYEPGLKDIVIRNHAKGRLHFSTNLGEAIKGSGAAFIAVGTPPGEDGSADLKYVLGVAQEIGQTMDDYLVVITNLPFLWARQKRYVVLWGKRSNSAVHLLASMSHRTQSF